MAIYLHDHQLMCAGAPDASATHHLMDLLEAPFEPWGSTWAARVNAEMWHDELQQGGVDLKRFRRLDRVAQMAVMLAFRLKSRDATVACIGTARGATASLEVAMQKYLEDGRTSVRTSPQTTAGSVASSIPYLLDWHMRTQTVSMTCSSALHAVIRMAEHLENSDTEVALAGGVEAPLTEFTRAQFEALRLLSDEPRPFPSRPLGAKDHNTVVLGEGGALIELRKTPSDVKLAGWGEAAEVLPNETAFAKNALKSAMQQALDRAGLNRVDLVIAHAPGTMNGDLGEQEAIAELMGKVSVWSTKMRTGHTLGASGAISMVLAQQLLTRQIRFEGKARPFTILVNATGFGGNAASVVLSL
jgi:3-oxoacyl-(acyl-carrier-protein) synthase